MDEYTTKLEKVRARWCPKILAVEFQKCTQEWNLINACKGKIYHNGWNEITMCGKILLCMTEIIMDNG